MVTAPGFLPDLRKTGADFRRALSDSIGSMEGVTDIRGAGLMIGIEFESPLKAGKVLLEAMRNGVLLSFCLSNPRTLRIYPPAVATSQELKQVLDVARHAVGHTKSFA